MAKDIEVRMVEIAVRTVKLTKAVLKQLRKIRGHEYSHCYDKIGIKPELVVGYIHGSVIGDEFSKYALVNLGDGDWGLAELGMNEHKKFKQIYVG